MQSTQKIKVGQIEDLTVIPRTFTAFQSMPTPTADAHAATKKYVDDKVIANRPVKNIAGNIYTLALEDKTKWLRFTHTGGLVTVTVPDAVFALDDELMGDSSGQDVVFVNGAGFTLKYPVSKKAEIPKDGVFGMRFRAVNSAVIFGSLKPI